MEPTAVVNLPAFIRDVLERCIDPLRNEEATYQAIVFRAALSDKDGFSKMIDRFKAAAEPYKEKQAAVIPVDDAARAWFIANGIPVIQ